MGSPISSTIAEIFLEHLETKYVKQLMDTKSIALYTQYEDDILIIYDTNKIQPELLHIHMNQIHNSTKLNPTQEDKQSINFFDLTIHRKTPHLEIDIYRKPTTTNTTINVLSPTPTKHKTATLRYHITRMHSLPLTIARKQKEWETIQQIAQKSNFPQHLLHRINLQTKHKNNHRQAEDNKANKAWTTFTYFSPQIRKITNLFKNTNVKIAFKNTNTLQQFIKPRFDNTTPEHEKSDIYKVTCNTCHMSYIGQTRRNLK
jgi:hypothetical protein